MQVAQFAYLFIRYFRLTIPDARCLAFLLAHIFIIDGLGTKEQVIWVAAGRIVAPMEDEKPFRDITVCYYPGKATCDIHSSLSLEASIPGG